MLLQRFETQKLFYDEYPYKLTVINSLCVIFREKNLSYAKSELDNLQSKLEKSEPLTRRTGINRINTIDVADVFEAQNMYIEFCNQSDYKLRVEHPRIQIYSHNYNWLMYLTTKLDHCIEFWEPNPNTSLEKNIIVVHEPVNYEYKITLGHQVDPALAKWIRSNPDKAKAGHVCLHEIENNGYVKGFYFYVRDEKILQLINLFCKPTRIDKLVYHIKNW